jgi:two-component system, LytTR family, sensor kinase
MQIAQHERQEGMKRPLRPGELFGIVAFWAFLAVLTAAGRLLDPRTPGDATFSRGLVTLAFIEYSIWAALTVPIFYIVERLAAVERGWTARILTYLVIGLIAAVAVDSLLIVFRHQLLGPPRFGRGNISGLRNVLRLEFLDDFLVFVAIMAAALARDYFLRYQARHIETEHLRGQLAEARLDALRAQLNPHFLFNTLNAVSSLVESDPRGVRRMISRLGDLLRHTLEETSESEITLARELELLKRYLEIMEVRFQGALDVRLDADPSLAAALVPNMILQPVVENAFKHGLAGMTKAARLEVSARRIGDELVLRVRDNGPGPSGDGTGTGIGVRNTRERLEALYGASQRFSLRRDDATGGAIAEIVLPFHLTPIPVEAGGA